MVYLKSCPKCLGDLTMGQDSYGTFINCLQCGFMRDIETGATAKAASPSPVVASRYPEHERLPRAA